MPLITTDDFVCCHFYSFTVCLIHVLLFTDNWAMLYAQRLALKLGVPIHVCFCLVPKFLDATIRHYGFMLSGLQEVQEECSSLDIEFHLLIGEAKTNVPKFVKEYNIGAVVTDFSPLRVPQKWVDDVKAKLPQDIPFCQASNGG